LISAKRWTQGADDIFTRCEDHGLLFGRQDLLRKRGGRATVGWGEKKTKIGGIVKKMETIRN